MPAKSLSQQKLFAMALQVRKGNLKRSDVNDSVLNIVDSDMSNKDIEDFASTKGLKEQLLEAKKDRRAIMNKYENNYANKFEPDVEECALNKKVFVIVKPGFLTLAPIIVKMFEDEGFKLYQTRSKRLLPKESLRLYYVHKDEDWYYSLCKYMSSDISIGMTFLYNGGDKNAIEKTDSLKKKIREKWSESDMRNVMHSSDSYENMKKESEIYF